MAKPKYTFVMNEVEGSELVDRYFLYNDILGFGDLVMREPDRVADLYEIISTLNAHRHDSFGTIVFSDTILVYPKFRRNLGTRSDAYFVMYLCEFAQDLMYRLVSRNIYFRAVLTQGKFTHYLLNEIPCFYGPALVNAFRSEKKIKAVGLFMDNRCLSVSDIFKTCPFNEEYSFVYLSQSLDEFAPQGSALYPIPFPDAALFRDMDLEWALAQDVLMLKNISESRTSSDSGIREKHNNTWQLLHSRYGFIMDELERNDFHPRVICPGLDWTESMKRAQSE